MESLENIKPKRPEEQSNESVPSEQIAPQEENMQIDDEPARPAAEKIFAAIEEARNEYRKMVEPLQDEEIEALGFEPQDFPAESLDSTGEEPTDNTDQNEIAEQDNSDQPQAQAKIFEQQRSGALKKTLLMMTAFAIMSGALAKEAAAGKGWGDRAGDRIKRNTGRQVEQVIVKSTGAAVGGAINWGFKKIGGILGGGNDQQQEEKRSGPPRDNRSQSRRY